jgi:hypothetical protein
MATSRPGTLPAIARYRDIDATAMIGFSLRFTVGERLLGIGRRRTVHYLEWDGVYDDETCSFQPVHRDPTRDNRSARRIGSGKR